MGKFVPKHLFEVISPTIFISIITGTCIFHLKRDNNQFDIEITKGARYMGYARVIFYIVFFIHAMSNPENLQIFSYYDSTLENLGVSFEVAVGTILVFVVYSSSIRTADQTKATLIKVSKLDKVLIQLNGDLKYRETYFYQLYNLLFGFAGYIMISVAQYANAKNSGLVHIDFSLRIIIYFPMFLAFIMEVQYITVIILIKYRFECINKQISAMNCERIFIINGINQSKSKNFSTDVSQKLDTLMHLYDLICDVVTVVNQHFGLSLIFSMGMKFLLTVFSLYYGYWSQVVKNRTWSSVIWCAWAVYHMSLLLHLCVCCQTTSTEAQQTGINVHKLLLNVRNANLKEKLTTFSLHLLHRPIRFTALELFTIDAPLYSTIVASGSTYLIIMLQFQEATEGDTKSNNIYLNSTHMMQISN